jgi:ABC-2 type transport system permease protein
MGKIWIIARKDVGEAFRSTSTYVYILILLLLTIIYFNNYSTGVDSIKAAGKTPAEIKDFSQVFLNDLSFNMPLWFAVMMCTVFSNYAIIVDKSKRSLESLMAAPVSLKQIWLGKALAVTIPSVLIGLAAYIIAYVALNYMKVIPITGGFTMPGTSALISAFILMPLLILAVVIPVIYLQLVIANPRTANFVFTGFFVVIFLGGSFLNGQGGDKNYGAIYLGIIIIGAGIALLMSRFLSREKVLLSNRN